MSEYNDGDASKKAKFTPVVVSALHCVLCRHTEPRLRKRFDSVESYNDHYKSQHPTQYHTEGKVPPPENVPVTLNAEQGKPPDLYKPFSGELYKPDNNSPVWEHCRLSRRYVNFAHLPCGKWLAYCAGNTSTIGRHLSTCKACKRITNPDLAKRPREIRDYLNPGKEAAYFEHETAIERAMRLNEMLKDGLAAMICSANVPISFVDNVHFRGVLETAFQLGRQTLGNLSVPRRTSVGQHLSELHHKMRAQVRLCLLLYPQLA